MKPSLYYTVMHGSEVVERIPLSYDWHELRSRRNEILESTDWRAMSDREMSEDWRVYRQLLRDLPSTYEDPMEAVVNWPDAPEGA